MKLILPKGTNEQTINIFIQDSTASDGSGKTGLTFSDMTCYYVRPAADAVAISCVTQTTTGAYLTASGVGGGFVEIDATNMPGVYRFDVPDACLSTGVDSVVIMLQATGAAPVLIEIQLVDFMTDITNIETKVDDVKAQTDQLQFDSAGNLETVAEVTGDVTLSSTGLDNIPITQPSGVATTFREVVVQTWRRFFKKATLTSSNLKTYNDAGSEITDQSVSNDGTTETIADAT
jgi:hypothetical protein